MEVAREVEARVAAPEAAMAGTAAMVASMANQEGGVDWEVEPWVEEEAQVEAKAAVVGTLEVAMGEAMEEAH